MTRLPRRLVSLAARVLTAAACTALVVPVVPSGPAAASQDQTAGDGTVGIHGLQQSRYWVTRNGTWQLQLSITGAPDTAVVETTIHTRIETRSEFNSALFGVLDGLDRLASIPSVSLDSTDRAPDGGRIVNLAVTLRSDEGSRPGWAFLERGLLPGVYPVEITVFDDEEPVGHDVVFLTRVPSDDEEGVSRPPVLVAPVLPLGAPPAVDPDGDTSVPTATIDDITATAEGLLFANELPATLVPRPQTIEALARDRAGQRALAELRRAAEPRQSVDGPWVDIPLTGWVARDLGDELTRQRERGHRVLAQSLRQVDSSTWFATQAMTSAAAAALWSVGVRSVVLPPGTVSPEDGATSRPFTIDAGRGRTMQAVVPDTGLGERLVRRGDLVLDHGDFAAELALLAASDDRPEGIVLVPPDDWPTDPEAVTTLAGVLGDPAAPVDPVTLSTLIGSAGGDTRRSLRGAIPDDLGDYPQHLGAARAKLGSYASLTGSGDRQVAGLDQRLLLSGARTLSRKERERAVASVAGAVDANLARIEAPTRQTITLTSKDGKFPLTLRSDLDEAVQVLIDLEADTRLDFPDGTHLVRTLDPGTNQIEIPVHARLPGDAPIDITVRTPDGAIVLDDVRYTVRSTAISGIGLVLSIGAALFLLLWWGRHWTQSRRTRRSDEGDDPSPGPGDPAPAMVDQGT